jgi:hypothetical protein
MCRVGIRGAAQRNCAAGLRPAPYRHAAYGGAHSMALHHLYSYSTVHQTPVRQESGLARVVPEKGRLIEGGWLNKADRMSDRISHIEHQIEGCVTDEMDGCK